MWSLSLGLSCFAAVLGQLFVSYIRTRLRDLSVHSAMLIASHQYFRPQTVSDDIPYLLDFVLSITVYEIYVSQLFIQIISYALGRVMETLIPGPGEGARVKTPDNRFWRFMNPGNFSTGLLFFRWRVFSSGA